MKKIIYILILLIVLSGGYLLKYYNQEPQLVDMTYKEFEGMCNEKSGKLESTWGHGVVISVDISCQTMFNKFILKDALERYYENGYPKIIN